MIPALFATAMGKIAPFRWYAFGAVALALVGLLAFLSWKIKSLQLQLAKTQLAQQQIVAESKATQAAQAQAQRRMDDIKMHTDWLLQQMGEDLPRTDEEAKAFFWKHAKEIGR
jgi:hypothetical protein